MSDMAQSLFDDEDMAPVPLEQVVFDYRLLSADKREFVMQKTDETQILLKRTAEKIIQIGSNLTEVKNQLPHGMFLPWLHSEFGMSQQTANNFMHVAERFAGKLLTVSNLPAKALYLLASPSTPQEAIDEALQRAESGEKITHTLAKQIIEAQEGLKKAQEAEANARASEQVAQQRLFKTQTEASSKVEELTGQIKDLEEQMRTIVIPEVRIEEKTVEVIPLKTQEELATLQVNVKKLEKDLEAQKEAIPVSTQKKLESLQKQLDKLKEEKKQQEEEHAQQEKRIKKLSEDANLAIRKREFAENADRIRQGWRLVNSEAHTCLMRLLGQWPTPVDAQTFDADDWAHVDHMEKTLQRVLDEYKSLRYSGGIIEDHASPYALSLNGHYIVESEMSHPD